MRKCNSLFLALLLVVSTLVAGTSVASAAQPGTKSYEKVYFDSDSAELSKAAKLELRKIAKKYAGASAITVTGFTRDAGPSWNNYQLSKKRANAVAKYLKTQGIKIKIKTKAGGVPKKDSKNKNARRATLTITMPAIVSSPTQLPVAPTSPVVEGKQTVLSGWGDNSNYQLGVGLSGASPVAVQSSGVLAGKTITAISSGRFHTCAIASGDVYCWGRNSFGQLGNNSTTDSSSPVALTITGTGVTRGSVTAIAAGGNQTCAIATGDVYCWGSNSFGQLGNDSLLDSKLPVAVKTKPTSNTGIETGSVTGLTVGEEHVCAISAGNAYCWGKGLSGRLGNSLSIDSPIPVAVTTGGTGITSGTVTAISAGGQHTCAISARNAYCWGFNYSGQLGDSSRTARSTAVAVTTVNDVPGITLGSVTAISAGGQHTCAISASDAYCWGSNNRGALGNDSPDITRSLFPVAVTTVISGAGIRPGSVTTISAGEVHSCAISLGDAHCWGGNESGQLGDNSSTTSYKPVAVTTLTTGVGIRPGSVTVISAGGAHMCALTSSAAYCWGLNLQGQLGFGKSTHTPDLTDVSGALAEKTISDVSSGQAHTCAIGSRNAYCWGYNESGQLGDGSTTNRQTPVAVSIDGTVIAPGTVTAISSGGSHTCVIASGNAFCWGYNESGQLGDGSTTNRQVPVAVTNLGVVTAIASGASHTCALSNGDVFCWGRNHSGQLGNGSPTNSPVPVAVTTVLSGVGITPGTVTAISVGSSHSCAIAGSNAYCWGYNYDGQLGNNSKTDSQVPVAVTHLGVVTAIDSGDSHTCALSNGDVFCWGLNYYGQLGDSSTTDSQIPVAVSNLSSVTAISSGVFHNCAISSGNAYCWGANEFGQLGDNSITNRSAPILVPISGTVVAISSGGYHTMALSQTN